MPDSASQVALWTLLFLHGQEELKYGWSMLSEKLGTNHKHYFVDVLIIFGGKGEVDIFIEQVTTHW